MIQNHLIVQRMYRETHRVATVVRNVGRWTFSVGWL